MYLYFFDTMPKTKTMPPVRARSSRKGGNSKRKGRSRDPIVSFNNWRATGMNHELEELASTILTETQHGYHVDTSGMGVSFASPAAFVGRHALTPMANGAFGRGAQQTAFRMMAAQRVAASRSRPLSIQEAYHCPALDAVHKSSTSKRRKAKQKQNRRSSKKKRTNSTHSSRPESKYHVSYPSSDSGSSDASSENE